MESDDIPLVAKLSNGNICLSGGASGADKAWGDAATNSGHLVVHWSFEGHKSSDKSNTYILSEEELLEADEKINEANASLKRKVPTDNYIKNLLRRSWHQIKYTDAVYAVGTLNHKANIMLIQTSKSKLTYYHPLSYRKDILGINGGTAWACQYYIDLFRHDHNNREACNLFFYDQDKNQSYKFIIDMGLWVPSTFMPFDPPSGIYTGIGTRNLNANGLNFIQSIYKI